MGAHLHGTFHCTVEMTPRFPAPKRSGAPHGPALTEPSPRRRGEWNPEPASAPAPWRRDRIRLGCRHVCSRICPHSRFRFGRPRLRRGSGGAARPRPLRRLDLRRRPGGRGLDAVARPRPTRRMVFAGADGAMVAVRRARARTTTNSARSTSMSRRTHKGWRSRGLLSRHSRETPRTRASSQSSRPTTGRASRIMRTRSATSLSGRADAGQSTTSIP